MFLKMHVFSGMCDCWRGSGCLWSDIWFHWNKTMKSDEENCSFAGGFLFIYLIFLSFLCMCAVELDLDCWVSVSRWHLIVSVSHLWHRNTSEPKGNTFSAKFLYIFDCLEAQKHCCINKVALWVRQVLYHWCNMSSDGLF